MKKELTVFLAGLSLLAILTSTPFTTAVYPFVEVEVGDSFKYVISKIYFWYEENNVVQAEETGEGIVNNQITVTVDAIFDSNDMYNPGLPYETTVLNVTESIGEQDFQAQTVLDMWYSTFISIEFLYSMLVLGFNPEDPSGIVVNVPDTSNYSFIMGLPIFATSNTTFYEEVKVQVNSTSIFNLAADDSGSEDPTLNPVLPNKVVEVSYIDGIFKLNVTNQDYFEGVTLTEIAWNIHGNSKYYVDIDTNKGLVNSLLYELSYKINIGGVKTSLHMKIAIEKSSSGKTITLGLTFLEPLLAVLGLTTFWVIARRKKK